MKKLLIAACLSLAVAVAFAVSVLLISIMEIEAIAATNVDNIQGSNSSAITSGVLTATYGSLGNQPQSEDGSAAVLQGIDVSMDSAVPDLFTGILKYSIPVEIPAGRKGVQPKLGLMYQSTLTNGWLGIGWELEIGAIERNTKRGLDYSGDNYVLRTKGARIELAAIDNINYQAKIEHGFLRIRANKDASGHPVSWEVTDKSGTRYLYGQTAASRQDDPGDPNNNIPPDPTVVFKWCLDYVVDTNGNYYQVHYTKDQGEIYLDYIEYTGNGTTLSPNNKVTFVRDQGSRTDAPMTYAKNFGVKTAYLLSRIDITANNDLVRSYQLSYTTSVITSRALLSSVRVVGKDGSAIPPITLDYSQETKGFSIRDWGTFPQYGVDFIQMFQAGDFNGDGRTDYLHVRYYYDYGARNVPGLLDVGVTSGTGSLSETLFSFANNPWGSWSLTNDIAYSCKQLIPGDFDGDGKTDLLELGWGCATNAFNVALSNGNGFGGFTNWLSYAYDQKNIRIADFNGDGKTDVLYLENGTLKIALSTGTSFACATAFETPFGNGDITRYRIGDFNGDGMADVLYIDSAGNLYVAYSTGNGFYIPKKSDGSMQSLGQLGNGANPDQYFIGDFNGDGKSDVVYVSKAGDTLSGQSLTVGTMLVTLSTGTSFTPQTQWGVPYGNGEAPRYKFADFDGNGMTDVLFVTGQTASYFVGPGTPQPLTIALSTGTGFTNWEEWGSMGNGRVNWNTLLRYAFGRFSGDGRTSILARIGEYVGDPGDMQVATNDNLVGNYLVKIKNGIGGSTEVGYSTSPHHANTRIPFPIQTVVSVKVNDGNGNLSETKYAYEGGYYHMTERDFRGFNHVTVTGPIGPNGEQKIGETWFHQGNDIGIDQNDPTGLIGYMKGKAYRTRISDNSGKVYSETTISYLASTNTSTNGSYFNPPDTVTTYVCDGSVTTGSTTGTCNATTSGQSMKSTYSYDSFGNTVQQQVYNSANVSTPYITKSSAFTTDSISNYIVGLPKYEAMSDATGTLTSTTYYYDDQSDCGTQSRSMNQTPTIGNVTTVVSLYKEKPTGGSDPKGEMSYDGFGNVICTRDPKGNIFRTQYDTDTHTYVTQTTAPLVQSTQIQQSMTIKYYGIDGTPLAGGLYGQVQSVTDSNSMISTMTYDALGRQIQTTDPYGAVVTYNYNDNNLGQVGQQHVTTTASVDYAGNTTWSEVYFDGLGRQIKTRSQGPDNHVIGTNTTYNPRGAVALSSFPYFDGTINYPTVAYQYDPMGRTTMVTAPTGTAAICYSNGVTVLIDADGHKERKTQDVFGRLIEVDQYDNVFTTCSTGLGASPLTTTYQYNTVGNLVLVTDAENNQTIMNYDSLSRKTSMTDPDMGMWSYTYDYNGNLLTQTDAKNQLIRFTYDELNRVIAKTYPDGTQVTYTYDVAPDGPATTYAIGRLSRMADVTGNTSFFYDKLGRATKTSKVIDATRYDFLTSYDALGRATSLTYPGNETVSYAYNTGGLLSAVTGTSVNYATYTGYNAAGQPGTVTYGNGIATNYTYDPQSYRLQSVVTGNTDQTLISLAYDYYNGGSIRDIVDRATSTRSQSFWYDGLNRLQQAQSQGYPSGVQGGVLWYNYSPTGNITMKEGIRYSYSGGHAVKSTTNVLDNALVSNYTYDRNGNMVQETPGPDGNAARTIAYNYDNMPQSVTVNNKTTSFVYDGNGNRVKKTGPYGEYVYLGKLYECKEGVCTNYIFGGDTRIAAKTGNDVLYYHGDHLSSTQVVTQTGAIQDDLCSSQPVRIAGATPRYFPTLQAAYNAASDGDTIQARAVNFGSVDAPVTLDLSSNVTVTINGGYDCGYNNQVENSELVGMINDNTGAATIGNFEIVTVSYAKHKADEVRYLPFGETLLDVGTLSVNHKYTGQEFDNETGLYNYNARLYNPALGRFVSADTIVSDPSNPQSLNRYSYVLNNPLRYRDPSGHEDDGGDPSEPSDPSDPPDPSDPSDPSEPPTPSASTTSPAGMAYVYTDENGNVIRVDLGIVTPIRASREGSTSAGSNGGYFDAILAPLSDNAFGGGGGMGGSSYARAQSGGPSGASNGGQGYTVASFSMNYLGTVGGVGQSLSQPYKNTWLSKSNKLYTTKYYGRWSTGFQSQAKYSYRFMGKLGTAGFFGSTFVSGFQAWDAFQTAGYRFNSDMLKPALDVSVGVAGVAIGSTVGAVPATVFGTGYWLLDSVGAFDRGYQDASQFDPFIGSY